VGVIAWDIFGSHPTISIVHAKVCKPQVAVEGMWITWALKISKALCLMSLHMLIRNQNLLNLSISRT
jgi:hypothetical protein